nr:hypothetical protein [Tanacetum cinerariifolium]
MIRGGETVSNSVFTHDLSKLVIAKMSTVITYDSSRGTKSGEERFEKFANDSGVICQKKLESKTFLMSFTSIINGPKVFSITLPQDRTYGELACVAHNFKWEVPVWGNQDWRFHNYLLSRLESFDAIFREDERGILLKKVSHRSRNFGKIFDESSVKTGVTEKTPNTFDSSGMR